MRCRSQELQVKLKKKEIYQFTKKMLLPQNKRSTKKQSITTKKSSESHLFITRDLKPFKTHETSEHWYWKTQV